ncbi:DUF4376 domain-containing protein [Neisseria polysaccharea]|uniref:DUF4376 domain-containing protein n=1 Tax=Neisseria polysaccharea TaxID=489 RepID=UPI0027E0D391|nr:DUF4376 domain-containing protein [Neisseria polysaccharea]
MAIYYKDRAFYDADTPDQAPEGARPITPEQHAELLAALNSGCIVSDDLTVSPPRPSEYHEWDGKKWKISKADAARLKAEQQDEVWEQIKAKRYDNRRHGVYAKSVGKWFQTDDATRLQYLALSLESVTGGFKKPINWKTMDNSFLQLTPELLREIMQTMHDDEQADFANAERHKAAMLKAENPLEYDYSGGWTANFNEQPAAELEGAAKSVSKM